MALARGKPLLVRSTKYSSYLITDRHSEDQSQLDALFRVVGKLHGVIPGAVAPTSEEFPQAENVSWAEALRVSIDFINGKYWLLLEPDIWIWPSRARKYETAFLDRRRSDRYNKKMNELLDAWVQSILGTENRNSEVRVSTFDEGSGLENPIFQIGTRTAFARRLVA
ncbi:MAG: hypothetical protein HQ503_10480 [Rhodospirillales bacterium]|nr:hypothetical protein [Rhodospirillales bacterium]